MTFRKLVRKIHLCLGLTVGLLFALMGLTGSLLVFSEEIDRTLNPHLLKSGPQTEQIDFKFIESAVRKSFPNDKILRIRMPGHPEDVYEFWMNETEGLRVYVDPYTGSVLGSRDFAHTFRGRLFLLHTTLLSGANGKYVIGVSAFLFLLIGITGMLLWWRGLRDLQRGLMVKLRSGWKRTNFDLHNAVGFFAFFLLSINAVSGIYLIFNAPFETTVNRLANVADRPSAPLSMPAEGAATLPIAAIFERAAIHWPEAEMIWIYPPATSKAAYLVRKKFAAENHPSGKSFIYLDQYSGEILRTENATEAARATRIVNDLYPMHIGRVGGTPHRVLQVFVGLTPAVLLITGFLIWRIRVGKSRSRST